MQHLFETGPVVLEEKSENEKSLQADRQTDDGQQGKRKAHSSSGELKRHFNQKSKSKPDNQMRIYLWWQKSILVFINAHEGS